MSVLIATAALYAAPARAQDGTAVESGPSQQGPDVPDQREQAAAHFRRGIELYKVGRFAEAFAAFSEAKQLLPSPAFTFNLARSAERMNDTARALRYYRDYVRESPNAEDLEHVSERIQALQETLAQRGVQQITVLSDPDGATVHLGDEPLGITPWTGEIKPGSYSLRLVRSGYEDKVVTLALSPERALDVTVRLSQVEAEPTAPAAPIVVQPPAPEPTASARPTPFDARPDAEMRIHVWTWGALAGGAIALAGAGMYELFKRDSEAEVPKHETQLARHEEYDDMKSYQQNARILLGVGGGLALIGGGLLLWDLSAAPRAPQSSRWAESRQLGHRSSSNLNARLGCDGQLCGVFMTRGLE